MAINAVRRRKKRFQTFRWAVGIEGSFIPHLHIDQYEWTQHDRFWKEDFRRVSDELGCRWLRYSVPWHLLEKKPGEFNWRWSDQRFDFARKLKLNLLIDLVHFGTPEWLPQAFGDVDFPAALERFSAAFGQRYAKEIPSVCPINEPLITSLFSGDIGLWPPHGRSLQNYMTVLSRVTQGLNRSIQALRQTMHGVEIILCDALEVAKVAESAKSSGNTESLASLQDDVDRRMQRRHIVTDLLFGRVTEAHPLYGWLTEHGFSKMDLKWFEQKATCVDVLGLDYYPHTEVELFLTPEGHSRQRVPEQHAGLYASALDYWERYRIPLMVTETSFTGSEKERRHWLEFTVQGVRQLRAAGVPVIGYTWWPLLDHLDWDGAMLHQVGHIHPVGIYALVRRENGRLDRVPTALRGDFQELIRKKETAIGGIANDLEKSGEAESESQEEAEPHSQRVQAPTGFPIIVHCHLRWDGVWQRPQQFLSRLARSHRVLFVEGPIVVEGNIKPRYEIRAVPEHPNVTVMQTFFPQERFFKDGAWVDSERYRLLKEVLKGPLAGQFKRPIQWFYDPMAAPAFVGRMGEIAIVYDCMDELSQFKFAPPEIIEREKLLLSNADVVFAGGRKMWESKRRFNSNAHFYGCGVEVEHFAKARAENTEIPHDICFVMKPILGYFGVVDERLDYELIARMAEEHPEWSIVLVGPVVKIDPASLPRRPHLYWLGRRDYAQLPNYAKAFDVCLMPFALNEATEYINPTKALEYMATGRPIVSTAIADVVSNFSAAVQIARSHEEFIQKCAQSLAQPDRVAIERGLLLARDNQWESIVAKLEQHIEDVLNAKVFPRQFAEKRFALSTASAI